MFPGAVTNGVGKVGKCEPCALFAGAAFGMDWFVVVMNFSLHELVEARFAIAPPIHRKAISMIAPSESVWAASAARAFNRRTVFFLDKKGGLRPVDPGELVEKSTRPTATSLHKVAVAVQHIE